MTSSISARAAASGGDKQSMVLPHGWAPIEDSIFETALNQTEQAFSGRAGAFDHVVEHLSRY
jgi:hypothetical protein